MKTLCGCAGRVGWMPVVVDLSFVVPLLTGIMAIAWSVYEDWKYWWQSEGVVRGWNTGRRIR
jgi:hypothetical protein